jgi:hypothetical protein
MKRRMDAPKLAPEGATMKKTIAAAAIAGGLLLGSAAPAFADPKPPTNGGNGAGQSGQCTGPAADRPASCQSSK